MGIYRPYLLILAAVFLFGADQSFAEKRLTDFSFEDWIVVVNEVELADGSVLFEYKARTFSGRAEGAMLGMSFVPRFNCEPVISIRIPGDVKTVSNSLALTIAIAGQKLQHSALVDRDGYYLTLSVIGLDQELAQLRHTMDVSARMAFTVEYPGTSETENVVFSLLGSRLASLYAEERCKLHEPIAYNPK